MQEFLKNSIAASCQVKERTFLAAMPQEFSGKQINLYRFPAKKNRMTKTETLGFTCFVLIGLVLMVAVPVSAVTVGSSPAAALTRLSRRAVVAFEGARPSRAKRSAVEGSRSSPG